jgi:2,4-dienoyl-CoA reductase-like NADH-dependent reductase (Old Yellow Enzyme family)
LYMNMRQDELCGQYQNRRRIVVEMYIVKI